MNALKRGEDMTDIAAQKTPVHLWIVGVVSLLWNSFGCVDYTMTQTRNAAYLAQFTDAQRAYFESFPPLMEAAWACGVWGALGGSLLLLLRSRHAVAAFAISLGGLALSTLWQFVLAPAPMPDMPAGAEYMNIAIWVIAIALLWYAWKQKAAGALR
jgi:hypothetical protein